MIILWNRVVNRFKTAIVHLPKSDMDLETDVDVFQSLYSYVGTLREFAETETSTCGIVVT